MRGYVRATWLFIGLWFLVCLSVLNYNGPFTDEAIYITAGQRTLEGQGYTDGYLVWFGGSLLWPVMAAVGYQIGGLMGVRLFCLILGTIGLIALSQASKNLFGARSAFWATVLLGINAAFLLVTRLAAYDATALAGMAVSFWAVTELHRRNNRIWLVVAALAFAFAVFGKYPSAAMILPLVGLIWVLRGKKAILDIGILGFTGMAISLPFFLPVREQLAMLPAWQAANKPKFGVTQLMTGYRVVVYSIGPLLLGIAGWIAAKNQRKLATVLLLSLLIWPAYHLLSTNPVSVVKHLAWGYVFALPLGGLALDTTWRNPRLSVWVTRPITVACVVVLTGFGVMQAHRWDLSWPDVRPAADYLSQRVVPDDQLLIYDAWPFGLYLYTHGNIHSPWDIFDPYRIRNGQSEIDLCEYDWFVDTGNEQGWSPEIRDVIADCGSFEPVFSLTDRVIGLGLDLNYVNYPWRITIWQNVAKEI